MFPNASPFHVVKHRSCDNRESAFCAVGPCRKIPEGFGVFLIFYRKTDQNTTFFCDFCGSIKKAPCKDGAFERSKKFFNRRRYLFRRRGRLKPFYDRTVPVDQEFCKVPLDITVLGIVFIRGTQYFIELGSNWMFHIKSFESFLRFQILIKRSRIFSVYIDLRHHRKMLPHN